MEQLPRVRRPDVRRYAQRHCLISDVDDAVQEALLLLARRLHGLRALAAFSAWLLRVELSHAQQSLPAHYREAIVLRDFEELAIAEIAGRLGLAVAAVKSRLHRARELAREYLLA